MADIKIYRLPKTDDVGELEAQSKPMRLARLKSLQQDPRSFKSKYEDEIDQPPEFWLGRLRPEDCQHFVAVTPPSGESNDIEFKAFMVLLIEAMSEKSHNIPTYMLGALWVDPSLRGQKVGSRIVEEGILWVREDARTKGYEQVRLRLGVAPGNYRAVKLYSRLGFARVAKDSEEDDDPFKDDFIEMRMTLDIV